MRQGKLVVVFFSMIYLAARGGMRGERGLRNLLKDYACLYQNVLRCKVMCFLMYRLSQLLPFVFITRMVHVYDVNITLPYVLWLEISAECCSIIVKAFQHVRVVSLIHFSLGVILIEGTDFVAWSCNRGLVVILFFLLKPVQVCKLHHQKINTMIKRVKRHMHLVV